MNRHIILTSFILAIAVSLVLTTSVTAQQFQRPTPESRVEQIGNAVTLTAAQKTAILKVYTDASGGGGRGGFGGATTEAVEKILTPDQVEQWRAYTLKQSVDRRITQIDEAVTLTDAQKKQIVPVLEKEIQAQTAMMTEMRSQGQNADREGMMEKMTAMRDATTAALGSILTKEQMGKFENMPRRGGRGR